MRKVIFLLTVLFFVITFAAKAQLMQSIFPDDKEVKSKKPAGPTEITSSSMDMDMKHNIVTLTGNVVVEDPENKLTADKIDVFLEENSEGKKEAKNIVATGNVVIIRKTLTQEEKAKGERKAMSGRADYNLKTGVVVLTEHPVIYQGGSFVRGHKITLWRDNDRMKIEGSEPTGQISKLVITDTNVSFPGMN